nr:type VII secretion system-associated protein [Streptomyces sp. AC627_RSS907]
MITGPENIPEPPQDIVRAARVAPDHWFYMPDPTWVGEGIPPEWAVLGRWRSDASGEIVAWQDNENYRPSPEALGWSEPLDDLDRALQWAATGYGPQQDVAQALAAVGRLAVLLDEDRAPRVETTPEGARAAVVFSLPPPEPGEEPADDDAFYQVLPVAEVSGFLPDDVERLLFISMSSAAALEVDAADILDRAAVPPDQPGVARPLRTVSSEPDGPGANSIEADGTEPDSAQPDNTEADATEPANTEPDATEPDSARPDSTQPAGTEQESAPAPDDVGTLADSVLRVLVQPSPTTEGGA